MIILRGLSLILVSLEIVQNLGGEGWKCDS